MSRCRRPCATSCWRGSRHSQMPFATCCGSRPWQGGRSITRCWLRPADLSEADLNVALRDAVEAYLLASESSIAGYSFRHALVREAIYSDLLAGERRGLHLRLARAISDQSGSAGVKSRPLLPSLPTIGTRRASWRRLCRRQLPPGPRPRSCTRPARRGCTTNARSRSGTPSIPHRASSPSSGSRSCGGRPTRRCASGRKIEQSPWRAR